MSDSFRNGNFGTPNNSRGNNNNRGPSVDLQARTLRVTNFHHDVTKELLKELFIQVGPVNNIVLRSDHAFVEFNDSDSVAYAFAMLNGTQLFGQEISLEPKLTTPETYKYQTVLQNYYHISGISQVPMPLQNMHHPQDSYQRDSFRGRQSYPPANNYYPQAAARNVDDGYYNRHANDDRRSSYHGSSRDHGANRHNPYNRNAPGNYQQRNDGYQQQHDSRRGHGYDRRPQQNLSDHRAGNSRFDNGQNSPYNRYDY
jgi:RNA recognition motif-containing protein